MEKIIRFLDVFTLIFAISGVSAVVTAHYVKRHDYESCWNTPLDFKIAVITSKVENGYIDIDKLGEANFIGPNCIEVEGQEDQKDWILKEYRKKTKYEIVEEFMEKQK
jgi:hypothetical protein